MDAAKSVTATFRSNRVIFTSALALVSPDGTLVVFASTLELDGTDAANAASTANVSGRSADPSALTRHPQLQGTDATVTVTAGKREIFNATLHK